MFINTIMSGKLFAAFTFDHPQNLGKDVPLNLSKMVFIFIRCSCVASPENFGFTTFFEVRKSYKI